MNPPARSRLLVMSNRLPINVSCDGHRLDVKDSVGGLSAAVDAARAGASSMVWIGWPGDTSRCKGALRDRLDAELNSRGLRGVELTKREIAGYYESFANGILWPVLHDRIDRLPMDSRDFALYEQVNARFAEIAARNLGDDDDLWVHDYQLFLVPHGVRARRPKARIGFFLHVPFPSPDIFAVLPWRARLLDGMLGADLVGFHTENYRDAFLATVARVLRDHVEIRGTDIIHADGRRTSTGVFPLGVDLPAFEAEANVAVEREMRRLREEHEPSVLMLGVDRLDYTKGINRRLLAVERLLEQRSDLRGRLSLMQVAVPSRENVEAYRDLRRQIDGLVGRINGKYTTLSGPVPLRYFTRSFSAVELIALYRAADVMVVTPTRDGMNLVAKEFVAARTDLDGVLVLSEFAGAAEELDDALLVNPYDIDGTAHALARAIDMPPAERRARMLRMRARIERSTPQTWAATFLAALRRAVAARATGVQVPLVDVVTRA
jgi:trehalose 6-phosphate synthase/phosphatase